MNTKEFNYHLPDELIAQTPVYPRDSSRLLVCKKDGELEHKHFFDIVDYLKSGDVLVVNNTKVLPARIFGAKLETGGKIELLLLKRINLTDWETLVKPGRIAKMGAKFQFGEKLVGEIVGNTDFGGRIIRFEFKGVFEDIISEIGYMPLPPYIHETLEDQNRYQTVYAKEQGSSAAPTAGLHFTPELMEKLKAKGVEFVEVMLHVGLGTFRPVQVEDVESHVMHSEYFEITAESAEKINKAKADGRRIVAVGTTSVRVLESAADENGILKEMRDNTQIFIYPPYKFKVVDSLITNFHLPESTLLMLVSAKITKERTLSIYETAVNEKYRFFSFGDAMFIE
ncbi:MAG: tRNA preQ1(34) S-adenosylmethionine ribosyltransferase-isomerase QueA [Bacillota bacterium]